MTSNNLEAIELLKTCAERLQDQGFSSHGNTVSELNKAIELLQADEVQNKPTYSCSKCKSNSHISLICEKPTKETKLDKLMKLKYRVTPEVNILANVVLDLIDLLEEEY